MLNLEFARRQRQMTQVDLSYKTRIASHFISLLENGRGTPSNDQAKRLAKALDVDVETLLQPVVEAVVAPRG